MQNQIQTPRESLTLDFIRTAFLGTTDAFSPGLRCASATRSTSMTTALRKAKGAAGFAYTMDERGRSPLDHLPPPANSNKPLTPFSIEDILSKPSVRRRSFAVCAAALGSPGLGEKGSQLGGPGVAGAPGLGRQSAVAQASPLCALEELASKTFKGLEVSVLQAAEGRDGLAIFGQRQAPKKRRKSRTAFTNAQIYELEKRFLYQKYLSPADRDQIAQQLGLTNAQVITWFQNRRAKLKRDLEEMKADVESAKSMDHAQRSHGRELPNALQRVMKKNAGASHATNGEQGRGCETHKEASSSPSPRSDGHSREGFSEDDDEDIEIDVDD
uniref:Ladybird homeobox 1a n=2 Tax=Eptatretus burgeri TaxID=7764 RepID=A0A8C4N2E3_EPTBU